MNLELRRKIAGLRGWNNLDDGSHGLLGGTRPDGTGDLYTPEWDCDLDAAGDLWVEIPGPKRIDDMEARAVAMRGLNPYGCEQLVDAETAQFPDPKERLCVAICRLWLAWKEAAA